MQSSERCLKILSSECSASKNTAQPPTISERADKNSLGKAQSHRELFEARIAQIDEEGIDQRPSKARTALNKEALPSKIRVEYVFSHIFSLQKLEWRASLSDVAHCCIE